MNDEFGGKHLTILIRHECNYGVHERARQLGQIFNLPADLRSPTCFYDPYSAILDPLSIHATAKTEVSPEDHLDDATATDPSDHSLTHVSILFHPLHPHAMDNESSRS